MQRLGAPAFFRDDFRRRVDAFSRDDNESLELAADANLAFELNRGLADELWEELLTDEH
jgi:heme oxygenase